MDDVFLLNTSSAQRMAKCSVRRVSENGPNEKEPTLARNAHRIASVLAALNLFSLGYILEDEVVMNRSDLSKIVHIS